MSSTDCISDPAGLPRETPAPPLPLCGEREEPPPRPLGEEDPPELDEDFAEWSPWAMKLVMFFLWAPLAGMGVLGLFVLAMMLLGRA